MKPRHEELRSRNRLGVALETHVRGIDHNGLPLKESTFLLEISRGGCSFRVSHEVDQGAELELEILRPSVGGRSPALFLTRGVVLRVSQAAPGQYTVGVKFIGPQFPTYSSETTTDA